MTDYYVDEDYEDALETEDGLGARHVVVPSRTEDKARLTEIEGRTSWLYLGFLLILFVLLVFFSWACDDRSPTPTELQAAEESAAVSSGSSVQLAITVDGDIVTLTGAVPDDAARQQILAATREQYGGENVIDELEVDGETTLDDGVVSVTGSAGFDDERPQRLRDAIVSALGLDEGEFSIDRGEGSVTAVRLEAQVDGETIRLAGAVPEQASVVDLTEAGEAVWGPGSVDVSGLTIGDTSWTDAVITVTGSAPPGDTRFEAFPAEVQNRFGALVTVDVSAVTVDVSEAALTTIQDEIAAELELQPIRFAPLSAEIDPGSDAVLVVIAEKLTAIPEVPVEVVGHTDAAGNADENLVLSQQRADAVIARLAELGVDAGRLSARGEGEAVPIADNSTPEGREQNRRIEFRLIGA